MGGAICGIRKVDRAIEGIVDNGIRNLVGDGQNTLFWEDLWVGEQRLKQRFPRLFLMSLQKSSTIADYGFWDGGSWHWSLLWRREFF